MTQPVNYPQNPKHLWNIFYDFTQTPRPSKKEEKIIKYIISLAEKENLKWSQDKASNLLIKVPASIGRENEQTLLIQNHIDMVTDCSKGVSFDFDNQPLELQVKDNWVWATDTTLGADNGIGCAAALATIFDKSVSHPPLELLFTVDEETGLHGALNLDSKLVSAKRMLNLDSEQWGTLYIGCSGGIDCELNKKFPTQTESGSFLKIELGNLTGGHSGLDIHRDRGNAIKMLADLLLRLKLLDYQLVEVRGGKAHNIIPRDAFAIIKINKSSDVQNAITEFKKEYQLFLEKNDHNFTLEVSEVKLDEAHLLSIEDSRSFVNFMNVFPHGVHGVDNNTSDRVVSQSNNMAITLLVRGAGFVLTSVRFFDRNQIKRIENEIKIIAENYGFEFTKNSEYPSWKPASDNSVLDKVKSVYKEMEGAAPEVTAIHAGLECGILMAKIGQIDAVSFGPTILDAHSPKERVSIESVEKFWNLYVKVLANI